MIDPSELDAAEFPLPQTAERVRPSSSLIRVDVAANSDKGKKRNTNQDHFLVARAGRHLDTLLSNLPEGELPARFDETGYIAIVADGMGGAAGGEVASRLAITTLINIVLHVPDWILRLDEEHAQKVMRRAATYYREVNEKLVKEARLKPELRGMGTTMTGAYSLGDDLFVAHVGDSRAYLYRDGILRRLTRDHTHAQMLAERASFVPRRSARIVCVMFSPTLSAARNRKATPRSIECVCSMVIAFCFVATAYTTWSKTKKSRRF